MAVNALGLITFLVLIALNVRQLYRDLRARRPGARLRRRMLSLFVALAVSPLLVVYGFSIDFLGRGIDSWFDVRVAQALKDALDLSRGALHQQTRKLLKQTEQLAYELMEGPISVTPLDLTALRDPSSTVVADPALPMNLDELRTKSGADELLLLTRKGGIIASSSGAHEIVPNLPSAEILLQLRQGRSYVGLDAIRDAALAVRVVVNVPEIGAAADPGLLQALYPVASRTNKLADNVHSAYLQYRELSYLRDQLKLSFVMTLTLVLLFSILGAVWAAFYSANRMVAPIQDLAAGTRAIAEGDYGRELHASSQDELGFLVESFNEMTRKIALARDEAKRSQDQVEAQRSYLEAVLGRLSSGVLTLDPNLSLRTANAAASKILGVELVPLLGQSVGRICAAFPYLQPFGDA
ncbi:MAG: sensor histidine kinase, partial [Gammaproteobacteria bacterium]